jgi:Zn-dependent protease with chaperone function
MLPEKYLLENIKEQFPAQEVDFDNDTLEKYHDPNEEDEYSLILQVIESLAVSFNVAMPDIEQSTTLRELCEAITASEDLLPSESYSQYTELISSYLPSASEDGEEEPQSPSPPQFFTKGIKAVEMMDQIRFSFEATVIGELNERFGLDKILESYKPSKDELRAERLGRASAVKLTKRMSPRMHSLLDKALSRLGNPFAVTLFIESSPDINAAAYPELHAKDDFRISITSRAIELLSDDEMLFILGHEIGHHYYGHFYEGYLPYVYGGANNIPRLLALRIDDWAKYAEFSADRCGFVATGNNVEATISAFFKMECGLGTDHINVDRQAIEESVSELQRLNSPDILTFSTHPLTPLRAYAINLLADSVDKSKSLIEAISAIEDKSISLAQMSDFQDMTEESQHSRNLIASFGLLLAKADGDELAQGGELNVLIEALSAYTSCPEEMLQTVGNVESAKKLANESAMWLSSNVGPERFSLFETILGLAVVDGACADGELESLLELAEMLAIPRKWVVKTIEDNLHGSLPSSLIGEMPAISLVE